MYDSSHYAAELSFHHGTLIAVAGNRDVSVMHVLRITVPHLIQSGARSGIWFDRSYRVRKTVMQHYLESVNLER